MREMKDSGISWIGKIPKNWDVHPVYFYFNERKHRNSLGKEKNLLSLSYGNIIEKDINKIGGLLPESFNTYNIVESGDIIIRPTDLQNDKRSLRTGLVKEHGIITSAYIDLMPIRPVNTTYYHYLLHAFDVMKVFYNMGNGVRQGLNFSEFSHLMLFEPPIEEQQRIADYLDTKCARIDSIRKNVEAEIEALKQYKQSVITEAVTKGLDKNVEMKDSGVEWIGKIPKTWKIVRLGFTSFIRARLGWKGLKADEYVDEGYAFISAFNIQNGQLVWTPLNYITKERYDESPEIKIQKGDVLVVKDGAGVGKSARVDDLPYGGAAPNSSIAVITPYKYLEYRYLSYYFQSAVFYNLVLKLLNGMGVPHLTQSILKNIKICLPPIDQQIKIANKLDAQCAEIDSIIASKQNQSEILSEYKKSLIYEVVTGKKEVPLHE